MRQHHTVAMAILQAHLDGGPEFVDPEPSFPAQHPGRDRAVLACQCGRVLDARDMVRIRTPSRDFHHDTSTVIYRIGCRACAALAYGLRRQG